MLLIRLDALLPEWFRLASLHFWFESVAAAAAVDDDCSPLLLLLLPLVVLVSPLPPPPPPPLLLPLNCFWIIWSICCFVKWNCVNSRQTRCSLANAAISVHAADDASKSRWSLMRKIISRIHSSGKSSSFGYTSGPGWKAETTTLVRNGKCECVIHCAAYLFDFDLCCHLLNALNRFHMTFPQDFTSQRFAPALLILLIHNFLQLNC